MDRQTAPKKRRLRELRLTGKETGVSARRAILLLMVVRVPGSARAGLARCVQRLWLSYTPGIPGLVTWQRRGKTLQGLWRLYLASLALLCYGLGDHVEVLLCFFLPVADRRY